MAVKIDGFGKGEESMLKGKVGRLALVGLFLGVAVSVFFASISFVSGTARSVSFDTPSAYAFGGSSGDDYEFPYPGEVTV